MAFHRWKIGLYVQQNGIRAVALIQRRGGWQLCQCWQIPLTPGGCYTRSEQLIRALTDWRDSLPLRHEVRLGFCAAGAVQRQLPHPGVLREADCERYIASRTAQQMQMVPEQLCWDYQATRSGDQLNITAAHDSEIALFRDCARRLGFNLVAVTPDACALAGFFPWLPPQIDAIVFGAESHWLWAGREQWGILTSPPSCNLNELCRLLALNAEQIIGCGNLPGWLRQSVSMLDPWRPVTYSCPPPATAGASDVIPLGLALGRYPQWHSW